MVWRPVKTVGDILRLKDGGQNQGSGLTVAPAFIQCLLNSRDIPGLAINFPVMAVGYPLKNCLLDIRRIGGKIF